MCIVLIFMKQRHDLSGRPEADAVLIERLPSQEGAARRAGSSISQCEAWRGPAAIEDCDAGRVASLVLEDVSASDLGSSVNCATYLAGAASLKHMAIRCLNVLMTTIHGVEFTPLAGCGLAVAVCEILFHASGWTSNIGSVDLQLAVGIDDRHLVIGLVAHPQANHPRRHLLRRRLSDRSRIRAGTFDELGGRPSLLLTHGCSPASPLQRRRLLLMAPQASDRCPRVGGAVGCPTNRLGWQVGGNGGAGGSNSSAPDAGRTPVSRRCVARAVWMREESTERSQLGSSAWTTGEDTTPPRPRHAK